MAHTYSQIYLQFVFAVKQRNNLISREHKEELHKYIASLVLAKSAKMLAVHCMPDHLHLFVGFRPNIHISDFVKEIKSKTNQFINAKKWVSGKFNWQEGYGVFSYSHSHIDNVVRYILNQESHHKKTTFREEYHQFLEKFAVPFNSKFVFEFMDEQLEDGVNVGKEL
jgi:REP element-mobilizing transposase RayT